MPVVSNSKYLFLLLFVFGTQLSYSQSTNKAKKGTQIQIKKGDLLTTGEKDGEKYNRIIGNAVFQHEDAILSCDSAYLYSARNEMEAFGNVHIEQGDSMHLYGDYLEYSGNTKLAEMTGEEVKLIDKDLTLTTTLLNFDRNTNTAYYYTGGRIVSDENDLTSVIGTYYKSSEEFHFKDSVILTNDRYVMNSDTLIYNTISKTAYFYGPTTIKGDSNLIYCENGWYNTVTDISQFSENTYLKNKSQTLSGDSLYYERNNGYGEAYSDVSIEDTVDNYIISGDSAVYYEIPDSALVYGKTLLTIATEKDSLFVHGDKLMASLDSNENKIIRTYYHVRLYKTDLQGKCDSLSYSYSDSTMNMYRDPILWSDNNQLTADHILLTTINNEPDSIKMLGNAFVLMRDEYGFFNQIRGKDMHGKFTNRTLRKLFVIGNGQTIYYAQDDTDAYIGMNRAECTNIMITIKDNKIVGIAYRIKPDSKMYPINQIPDDKKRLKGYNWRIKEQPKSKEDIFIWVEPQSK